MIKVNEEEVMWRLVVCVLCCGKNSRSTSTLQGREGLILFFLMFNLLY